MWVHRRTRYMVLAGSMVLLGSGSAWLYRRPPLPRYELVLEGGRAIELDQPRLQTLDADSRLSLTLRPERASSRCVFVHTVVQEQSRQVTWPILFERSPQGTLRLQGTPRELRLPCRTRCTITLYVSGFVLFPAFWWLLPGDALQRLLPPTQTLQADIRFEPLPGDAPAT